MCSRDFGRLSDDSAKLKALLDSSKSPQVSESSFQTILRWGGREISFVEVVKMFPQDGFSVVAVSDIGKTLYSARIDKTGGGKIISNVLPVSDKFILENLIAELLVLWDVPDENSRLYVQPDGKWALVSDIGKTVKVYIFDDAGNWLEFRRISSCWLKCKESFEWKQNRVLKLMRVENYDKHYKITREFISSVP